MAPTLHRETIFENGGKTLISIEQTNFNILYASNKNSLTKILQVDHPEIEPDFMDTLSNLTALKSVSDSTFIMTNLNGDAWLYNYKDNTSKMLLRTALPLRDCDLIYSGTTAIFSGDDLELNLVDLTDGNKLQSLAVTDQVHQLSYNLRTNMLAVSLINGEIHFFSLTSTKPNQVKVLNGYIPKVSYKDNLGVYGGSTTTTTSQQDTNANDDESKVDDDEFCPENRISTRVAWSPSGHNFAVPCLDMTVKVFSLKDYKVLKTLNLNQPVSNLIDLKFDPYNGQFLASIDLKNYLTVWDWKSGEIVYEKSLHVPVTNMLWRVDTTLEDKSQKHLHLIIGTWKGSLITIQKVAEIAVNREFSNLGLENSKSTKKTYNGLFVDSENSDMEGLMTSDYNDEEKDDRMVLDDMAQEGEREDDEGMRNSDSEVEFPEGHSPSTKKRKLYDDDNYRAIDNLDANEDNFIEDDDGAGYVEQSYNKTSSSTRYSKSNKRYNLPILPTMNSKAFKYRPISPGGTPFGTGERRYLTMNTIGYVNTVCNNEQYSVTVSFFDTGRFNEYHFEDLFGFDVCYLNDKGVLFAQSKTGQIQYRPHVTVNRNWTKIIPLNKNEIITTIAATPKRVIVGTSFGYVRTFNQFGIPLSVEKMSPVVALTAYEYRVFLVHFSKYHGVSFSLYEQSPERTVYFHRESSLPIPLPQTAISANAEYVHLNFDSFNPMGIKSLFFSEYGDPCIFGKDDVLLILNKWRRPKESRWVPILDSNMEIWRMSGGKESHDIHVWPLGLTTTAFSCILVKGKNVWPIFPLPLPTDMELRMPVLVKKQLWENHLEKQKERESKREQDGIDAVTENNDDNNIELPVEMQAEEESVRNRVLTELLTETIENEGELYGNENSIVASLNLAYDKAILKLIAVACSNQETEKALSLVQELKQDAALNAAGKIAQRAEMMTLMRKINEMREVRFEREMGNM
ncbi:chromatin-binding protein CTF4 PWA37_000836 [Arxiozyma heterogenica]|uniref:chromatin-binding protein CTF4 n=1 Tax=Arxiozyma heterogenica TaxID=278026 RepID=UPI002EDE2476